MSNETKVSVTRRINAAPAAIFDLLSNPERHPEFDGSGFVKSADRHAERVTGTGQMFRMNMEGEHMGGEYQTDNHVTGYVDDKLVAWQTAPAGTEPKGWEWMYELDAKGPNETEVTLTYDWSKVTDKELLKKVHFPLVQEHALEESLQKLSELAAS